MPARHVRHALVFCLLLAAHAFAQAPQLRLPAGAAPERYRVELAIDPAMPAFDGVVHIDVRLERASDIV